MSHPDRRYLTMEERGISGEIRLSGFHPEYLELVLQRQEVSWLKRAFTRGKVTLLKIPAVVDLNRI